MECNKYCGAVFTSLFWAVKVKSPLTQYLRGITVYNENILNKSETNNWVWVSKRAIIKLSQYYCLLEPMMANYDIGHGMMVKIFAVCLSAEKKYLRYDPSTIQGFLNDPINRYPYLLIGTCTY